jgi:hypothetical protein
VAGGNECQIAPAPNGSLIMTTRGGGWLNMAWSQDAGENWTPWVRNTSGSVPYVGPSCEASILRVPNSSLLLASTPFDPLHEQRQNMTVWQSADSGAHWSLLAGVGGWGEFAVYSAVAPFNTTHVALVWEMDGGNGRLVWDVVPLDHAAVTP